MRVILNRISTAFMAGLVSAGILFFIFGSLKNGGVALTPDFKAMLYKLMVWGGVWAILLVSFKPKNVFLRGSLIGAAVIFFNFIVLMPLRGQGFFASNAGAEVAIINIVFNYLWGLLAAWLFSKMSITAR